MAVIGLYCIGGHVEYVTHVAGGVADGNSFVVVFVRLVEVQLNYAGCLCPFAIVELFQLYRITEWDVFRYICWLSFGEHSGRPVGVPWLLCF